MERETRLNVVMAVIMGWTYAKHEETGPSKGQIMVMDTGGKGDNEHWLGERITPTRWWGGWKHRLTLIRHSATDTLGRDTLPHSPD